MRIDRLRIENFRRFRLVDLELPDGVTALVGRNGAGKSTLLESIGWCLYGHDAARTSKDLLKRRGANPGEDVRVYLAFRLGPHAYEVTRELLGKAESHVATVKVDGKVVVPPGAQSQKEATGYVTRLFHMDREAFFTSLVARQRELAALTDAKAADRKRILVGLLRLDALDDAIGLARARKRDARSELLGLRAALKDPKTLQDALAQARATVDAADVRIRESEARIMVLVDEVEAARQKREQGRKLAEEFRLAQAGTQTARERVTMCLREKERRDSELKRARDAAAQAGLLAPRLAALPGAQERCERLASLRVRHEELVRVRAELGKAQAEAAAARAEAERAQGVLGTAGTVKTLSERVARERPRLEGVVHEAQRAASDLDARVKEAARALHEVERRERNIVDMGPESPCPTCTRPLREHHDGILHGLRAERDAHRAFLAEATPQLAALRKQEADARAALAALAERENELRVKMANLAREEATLAAARSRASDAEARAARLRDQERFLGAEAYDPKADEASRRELRELEMVRERHQRFSLEAEREPEARRLVEEAVLAEQHARAVLAEAEKRLVILGFDPAQHDALEKACAAAEARLTEARLARERLVGERARHADAVRRLDEEIAQQEALAAKAKDLEARVLLLEQLAGDRDTGLFPEFKDHLVGRIRPILSTHAGRLFRDLTEGRYADLEVGEDYSLLIHDEGKAYSLERFSGGEGDLANLCLRLAVSQVVAERAGTDGFGFLALDEVFGSQDDVRKGNILRGLKALGGRFRQILLITHVGDVKDSTEHVLRVEALEDGTSRVVLE